MSEFPIIFSSLPEEKTILVTGNTTGTALYLAPHVENRKLAVLHPVEHSMALFLGDVLCRQLTPLMPHGLAVMACMHNPPVVRLLTACCNAEVFSHSKTGLYHVFPFRTFCLTDGCSLQWPRCPPTQRQWQQWGRSEVRRAFMEGWVARMPTLEPESSRAKLNVAELSSAFDMKVKELGAVVGMAKYRFGIGELVPGELGLRDTFRKAIAKARSSGASALLWLEDDVQLDHDFATRWVALQCSTSCFGFLHEPGGVLMLGASEYSLEHSASTQASPWSNGASEMFVPSAHQAEPFCYDALHKTLGTFAVILSHHTFEWVTDWLENSNLPIDHAFGFLARRGFPVRVAYPNLMVMDVVHTSHVHSSRAISRIPADLRMQVNYWSAKRYRPLDCNRVRDEAMLAPALSHTQRLFAGNHNCLPIP